MLAASLAWFRCRDAVARKNGCRRQPSYLVERRRHKNPNLIHEWRSLRSPIHEPTA